MIKTVAFDIGNVLIFFSYQRMLAQTAACTGINPAKVQEMMIQNKLRDRYETGAIESDQLYKAFAAVGTKPFTKEQFFHSVSDIFTPNTELFPIVEGLKAKGLRLILLSNTSPAHLDFLRKNHPIFSAFDASVLSFEVKASKPAPEIYKAALKAAGCAPSECFYTDDIPDNVTAARTHGIDAEIFTNVSDLKRHLLIRELL